MDSKQSNKKIVELSESRSRRAAELVCNRSLESMSAE